MFCYLADENIQKKKACLFIVFEKLFFVENKENIENTFGCQFFLFYFCSDEHQ